MHTKPPTFGDQDLYLFNEGSHFHLYEKLGAHPFAGGVRFATWAPNAERVSVVGDFNGWKPGRDALEPQGSSGIWSAAMEGAQVGSRYKYHITGRGGEVQPLKADPFAFHAETSPDTASIVWDLEHGWDDAQWMQTRGKRNALDAPMAIYEMHLESWRRVPEEGNRPLTYREMAPLLADHLERLGFTHVELLPDIEHPFGRSWGYQTTGYFAPTSRFGTPQDFMAFVEHLHRRGFGVILDWAPAHFPNDAHGLARYDGTHLFEHEDPRLGFHPDWQSAIFNYGRHEVRSFLISSALFWLDRYHIDGLRVDAVASMLYLDYSRKEGEWIPNRLGGRENLDAITFLRRFNEEVYRRHPDVQTIAEESTSWPMVSRPTEIGGLGFGLKWDMGWMHDMLAYMQEDPIHRKYHHGSLTFRMVYAWHENFVLPLSHDEVVHGKGSLLGKMPGDDWQRFANLRTLLGDMVSQPGKKLLFMGCELAQWKEWSHEESLDWHLLDAPLHASFLRWVEDLFHLYLEEPAMHAGDCNPEGFQWVDCNDSDNSVLTFLRHAPGTERWMLVALNFTPIPRTNHRIGVPRRGHWEEILNSDSRDYGGSGWGNLGGVDTAPLPSHGHMHSLMVTLPPLSAVFFRAPAG